jgi:hypothetical protein
MTTPAPVFQAARRPRTPLTVDLAEGIIQAGGHRARFDPAADDAVELAYLKLVRRMRDVHREPSFVLRSDDVEALAAVLRRDAVAVLDRLGELMGATVTQRRSMVTSFLAGALLIAVATSAVALGSDDGAAPEPDEPVAGGGLSPGADGRPIPAGELGDALVGAAHAEDALQGDALAEEALAEDGTVEGAPASDTATPPAEPALAPPTAVRAPATSPPAAGSPPDTGASPSSPEEEPPAVPRDRRPAPDAPGSGGVADGVEPPAPARPAPMVEGEPDTWTWDDPEVDQPGAIIDIPSDPEVVEPGTTDDPPGDDPEVGAA